MTKMLTVIIHAANIGGRTSPARPCVNGKTMEIQNETPTDVPKPFYDNLKAAGYDIEIVGEVEQDDTDEAPPSTEGDGDGAGAEGGESGNEDADLGTVSVDAAGYIDQNAKTVAKAIKDDDLSDVDLDAIEAAEKARDDGARKGVTDAIAAKREAA